ncbi:MAG: sulfatase [Kiritimatiellia bacterium]
MSRPNLLFIFSDQQSWDTLGAYGNGEVRTPNLDRLAGRATVVEYAFANNPVCTPSRGMLLTGRHTWDVGAHVNDQQLKPGQGRYFAEVLTAQGYRSAWIGKWHLYGGDRNRPIPPGPFRYGFDEAFLSNNCTVDFRPDQTFFWNEAGEKVPLNAYEPDGQTGQAVEYIRKQAGKSEPWNLFISWHPPHNPHEHCPEKWSDLYNPDELTLRPGMPDTKEFRVRLSQYYGMISNLDWNFGRLVEVLKETGQYENTLIVYTSDHGDTLLDPARSWHPRSYKQRPEDVSLRVPLIVSLPGQTVGRRVSTLVGTLDVMPTVLGLLSSPVPEGLQGQNLSGLFRGDEAQWDRLLPIWNIDFKWRGVVNRRFTYSTGSFQSLFDREKDPLQMRNVYDDPEYAGVQAELHAATLAWMKEYGDDLDLAAVPVTQKSQNPYQLVVP